MSQLDEIRALQKVVENATLRERKRCYELVMRLWKSNPSKELFYLGEAIKLGYIAPTINEG